MVQPMECGRNQWVYAWNLQSVLRTYGVWREPMECCGKQMGYSRNLKNVPQIYRVQKETMEHSWNL